MSRPVGAQVRGLERAVAGARRAAPVAVVDEHAEVLTDHATAACRSPAPSRRRVRCHTPSMRGSSTACFAAVLQRFDAPGAHGARPGAAEEQPLLPAALVVEGQPDAIADGLEIERRQLRGVEHQLVVAHQQREEQPAFVRGGQQAQAVAARARDAHQVARVRVPFVGAAVDERRAGQHHRRDVARVAARRVRAANRRGTAVPAGP